MSQTKVYKTLKRVQQFNSFVDPDLLHDILALYPENTMFQPQPEHFAAFQEMNEYNLVVKLRTPVWKDDIFKGAITMFAYNWEIDFSNIAFVE